MNNLAPMKNCPGGGGVQGNLNWMPGYDASYQISRPCGFRQEDFFMVLPI